MIIGRWAYASRVLGAFPHGNFENLVHALITSSAFCITDIVLLLLLLLFFFTGLGLWPTTKNRSVHLEQCALNSQFPSSCMTETWCRNLWRESEAKCEVMLDGTKNKSSKGIFHGRLVTLFRRWFIVLLLAAQMGTIIVESLVFCFSVGFVNSAMPQSGQKVCTWLKRLRKRRQVSQRTWRFCSAHFHRNPTKVSSAKSLKSVV